MKQDMHLFEEARRQLEGHAAIEALLNAATESAMLMSLDGTILAINEVAARRLNSGVYELLNRNVFDCFPFHVSASRKARCIEVTQTGMPVRFRDERDGKIYDNNMYPVFDDQGQVMAIAVYANDITQALARKKEIQESESKYRMLVETMNDGLGIINEQAVITYVNERYCEIMKFPKEEVLERPVTDFLDEERQGTFWEQFYERKNGIRGFYEIEWIDKYGEKIPTILSAQPIYDNNQKFAGSFAVITDIRKMKETEGALRESEERYRTLIDFSPDAITVVQDNHHQLINSEFTRLFGFTQDDVKMGLPAVIIVKDEARDAVLDRINKRIAGEKLSPEKVCVDFVSNDGRVIPCETSAARIHFNGRPASLVIIRDITERKKTELALRNREKELKAKAEDLEEANIALKVLLNHREKDKASLEKNVLHNIEELVLPFLEQLKNSPLNKRQEAYLKVVESNLKEIVSPFVNRLSTKLTKLTPTEIKVSNLVRQGKTIKEAASLLHLSTKTVETHRKNIRRKIGLRDKKQNLRSHLMSV